MLINGSRGASRRGNAELPGSRSPVWFFGASRLGNQTFDRQDPLDNRLLHSRYQGEPAGQLGISSLRVINEHPKKRNRLYSYRT